MNDNRNVWAVVLAAGEGTRLSALTMTSAGIHVPKQFCSLLDGPSLLDDAMRRAQSVALSEQVCTIVAAQHRRWWTRLPVPNTIVQPRNRGTANGVLLTVLHIAERDPDAQIVFLPSDHHVRDEPTLAASLRCIAAHLRLRPAEILLLGIEPAEPDPELGYILPGKRDRRGAYEVAQFVEKPTVARASELIDAGALWNAFIVAATAQTLLRTLECRFPDVVKEMRDAVRADLRSTTGASATTELYERLPEIDFSRHVLGSGREPNLRVLPVPQCGWSDLGTSRRVAETLRKLGVRSSVDTSFDMDTHISLAARLGSLQRAELRGH